MKKVLYSDKWTKKVELKTELSTIKPGRIYVLDSIQFATKLLSKSFKKISIVEKFVKLLCCGNISRLRDKHADKRRHDDWKLSPNIYKKHCDGFLVSWVTLLSLKVPNAPFFLGLRKPRQVFLDSYWTFQRFPFFGGFQGSFDKNVTKSPVDTRASQSHDKFNKSFLMKRSSKKESLNNFITQEHNRIEEENFGKSHEHKKIYICHRPKRRSTKEERNKISM